MPQITFFPASATHAETPPPVTQSAVLKTDESRTFNDKLGGYHTQFRLNMDPWDLQRIIAEANRMGREGTTVIGFGYDHNKQSILLAPKESPPDTPDELAPAHPASPPALRPGQLKPNELEMAILERIVANNPGLKLDLPRLHVLSRKYTGVGSFTEFLTSHSHTTPPAAGTVARHTVRALANIIIPGLQYGLGNIAFLLGDELKTLELYTYGDEKWDGTYEGFRIE